MSTLAQRIRYDWLGRPFVPSVQTIQDAVNARTGRAIISPRYKLLDRNLNAVDTGVKGPYNDDGDISGFITAGAITCDTTADVQRSAQLVMQDPLSLGFNPIQHRIQVFCDYWNDDGSLLFEAPVGIFYAPVPDRSIGDSVTTDTLQMADITGKLALLPFLNSHVLKAGSRFWDACTGLLQIDYLPKSLGGTGVTNSGLDLAGPGIPLSRIQMFPTSLTLPADVICDDNQSFLAVENTLLTAINYRRLMCDSRGITQLQPRPDLSINPPAVDWTYAVSAGSVIMPGITDRLSNPAQIANIVKLKAQSFSQAAITSIAYNVNMQSSISLPAAGEAMIRVITDSSIPTQALADARVRLECMAAASAVEQVQIQIPPNPFFEGNECIALTVVDQQDRVLISSVYGFQLVGWQIDLHARTMLLILQRLVKI